jgi:hypothetical protein
MMHKKRDNNKRWPSMEQKHSMNIKIRNGSSSYNMMVLLHSVRTAQLSHTHTDRYFTLGNSHTN